MRDDCPFCRVEPERIRLSSDAGIVLRDAYPVSEGHSLVVPKEHVTSIYDLSEQQQLELWRLVGEARLQLAREVGPDGFNIGLNDGQAAGQTVAHAHIHVIPRFSGDVADPRGGLRWIIPKRARYW